MKQGGFACLPVKEVNERYGTKRIRKRAITPAISRPIVVNAESESAGMARVGKNPLSIDEESVKPGRMR
jgi:hypothetical protein